MTKELSNVKIYPSISGYRVQVQTCKQALSLSKQFKNSRTLGKQLFISSSESSEEIMRIVLAEIAKDKKCEIKTESVLEPSRSALTPSKLVQVRVTQQHLLQRRR